MTSMGMRSATRERGGGVRRRRDVQRAVHVVVGVAVLVQLYAGMAIGPAGTVIVQALVAPVLVLSGAALWKGHRMRRVWRRHSDHRG